MTRDQLKQQYDAENTFFKFDDDCSGTLTLNELAEVFAWFKIDIDLQKIGKVFNLLDLDSNCTLSLDEFRGLQKNKQANDLFREIVKQAR